MEIEASQFDLDDVRSRENNESVVLVNKSGGDTMMEKTREKTHGGVGGRSHHYSGGGGGGGNHGSNYHYHDTKTPQSTMTILLNGGGGGNTNREASSPRDQPIQHRSKYYNNKSRGGNVGGKMSSSSSATNSSTNEFVMLQRPTILAKPQPSLPSHIADQVGEDEGRNKNNPAIILETKVDSNNKQQTPPPTTLTNVESQPTFQLLIENKQPTTRPMIKTSSAAGTITSNLQQQIQVEVAKKDGDPIKSYTESIATRLIAAPQMTTSVRLLDENLQWQESPLADYLLEHNNGFLVVGVLGKKGTGKSTLMSQLADSSVFRSAAHSDLARHCTSGIDAFVTSERTILLDVQPLLSASVLDRAIAQSSEKKTATSNLAGADFKFYENYIELQSLELACFLLSICNVVLVTEDWFCDPNLLRLLLTVEMLLPNMNTVFAQSSTKDGNKDGSSNTGTTLGDDSFQQQHVYDHHPHLIYVLNKTEYVNRVEMSKMKMMLHALLRESKLLTYRGSLSNSTDPIYSSRVSSRRRQLGGSSNEWENVNLVCLPKSDKTATTMTTDGGEFRGMPSSAKCVKNLLKEILALKRTNSVFMSPISTTSSTAASSSSSSSTASLNNREQIFTEKKWFNFAGKVWDAIRKSPLIAEYNRLMT